MFLREKAPFLRGAFFTNFLFSFRSDPLRDCCVSDLLVLMLIFHILKTANDKMSLTKD